MDEKGATLGGGRGYYGLLTAGSLRFLTRCPVFSARWSPNAMVSRRTAMGSLLEQGGQSLKDNLRVSPALEKRSRKNPAKPRGRDPGAESYGPRNGRAMPVLCATSGLQG